MSAEEETSTNRKYAVVILIGMLIFVLLLSFQAFKQTGNTQDNIIYDYKFIDLNLSKNYTNENISMTLEDRNVSFIYEQYNQTKHEITMFMTIEDHDNTRILIFPLIINYSIIDNNNIGYFNVTIIYDYENFAYLENSKWIEHLTDKKIYGKYKAENHVN